MNIVALNCPFHNDKQLSSQNMKTGSSLVDKV